MVHIVTGAAGFIGSNIIKGLNNRGIIDIVAVDDLTDGNKFLNLVDCQLIHYMDKKDFIDSVCSHNFPFKNIQAVFHQGACSDTMNHDGCFMMKNNYEYTLTLFDWCQDKKIPFYYASSAAVYGRGSEFEEKPKYESPLNVYGYSKLLFDQVLRYRLAKHPLKAPVAGFRYFNVYGINEQHKERMASVAFHHYKEFLSRGFVELFGAYEGYEKGEQQRDFVSVEDVVKVNLFFLDHPHLSGIFNLGTGRSQSFNDLAKATINSILLSQNKTALSLEEMQESALIRYIDFPESLKGKYQSYTKADISQLRNIGYPGNFFDVETGVKRYIDALIKKNQ